VVKQIALHPQRLVRQVSLPEGLEGNLVGRLDLALTPDRLFRQARKARFRFGGQGPS